MSVPEDSIRIRSVCSCGAKLDVESSPPDAALAIREMFASLHDGPGHERTPPPKEGAA